MLPPWVKNVRIAGTYEQDGEQFARAVVEIDERELEAELREKYDFDMTDVGTEPRGVSTVCGWCMGAVGSSGECENGCARHERGQE